jgi:hypothetical protein
MDAMEHRMSTTVMRFALLVRFAGGGCVWTPSGSFRPRKEASTGLDPAALLCILQRGGRRRVARAVLEEWFLPEVRECTIVLEE